MPELQTFAVGDTIIIDSNTRVRGREVEVAKVTKVNPKTVNTQPYGDRRIVRYNRTGTTNFGSGWDAHTVTSFPADDPRAAEAMGWRALRVAERKMRALTQQVASGRYNSAELDKLVEVVRTYQDIVDAWLETGVTPAQVHQFERLTAR